MTEEQHVAREPDEKRTDQLIKQVRENVGRLKLIFEDLEQNIDELEATTARPSGKGSSP